MDWASVVSIAITDQFWPIIAQVVPVLALAIIIEARTTMQRWPEDTPRYVRRAQGTLWAVPLILFVLAEIFAFQVLAGQAVSTTAWVVVAQTAISMSIAVLIIVPTLQLLVRTNARAVARGLIMLLITPSRWRMFRLSRRVASVLRDTRDIVRQLRDMERLLDSGEKSIRALGHPDCEFCKPVLAEAQALRQKVSNLRERAEAHEKVCIDMQTLFRDALTTWTKQGSETVQAIEVALSRGDSSLDAFNKMGKMELPVERIKELNSRITAARIRALRRDVE